jgi:nickel/cobalt transporter (NicO) family protein
MTLALALVGAAIGVGAVHTCAPDHWVPFAAMARAQHWEARRTAWITAWCGLGHVTVSVALGLLALVFGREIVQAFGERLESLSGLLLIGFGVAYAAWGLRGAVATRIHEHAHVHGHAHVHFHVDAHAHVHDRVGNGTASADFSDPLGDVTPWTLFVLFSADPCVAVIPLIFASASLGWGWTLAVVAAYEIATIATMIVLVLPARAAAGVARGAWADRYGDALAGCVVAVIGFVVIGLGI